MRRWSSTSAGCGAAMKEYGELLGTPEAHAFSARVPRLLRMARPPTAAAACSPQGHASVVQDSVVTCATSRRKHGGGPHRPRPRVPNSPRPPTRVCCCGAGGAYSVTQRELSERILERKVDAFARPPPAPAIGSWRRPTPVAWCSYAVAGDRRPPSRRPDRRGHSNDGSFRIHPREARRHRRRIARSRVRGTPGSRPGARERPRPPSPRRRRKKLLQARRAYRQGPSAPRWRPMPTDD